MINIMTICFKSVKHRLTQAVGFFELLGFDFMLDANLNVRGHNFAYVFESMM